MPDTSAPTPHITTAAPARQAPATDRDSAPTDWIDGHPLLEAIAAAVWEQCGRSDSGMCVEDDPRNIAVAALAAVLPTPADRAVNAELASLAVNTANALRDEKRHYEIACEENGRLRAAVERVRTLADAIDAEMRIEPDTQRAAMQMEAVTRIRAALDGHELRRLTAETPQSAGTLCSEPPCNQDGNGEPCDRHETERAHAEGEHEYCGVTCGEKFPTEMLRNGILAKGYPGTAGMLDELLRRAAAGARDAAGGLR